MKSKEIIFFIIFIVIIILLFAGYNIFRYPTLFRKLEDRSLSSEDINKLVEELKQKENKKTLIAYFSYSGTTKRIAESLHSTIDNSDLFAITPKEEYKNVYTQGNNEIRFNKRPELKNQVDNIEQYDVIFIGFPVWFHATPALINTFLESYDLTNKIIIPFCTSGGSDIEEAMPTFLNSSTDLAIYGEKRIRSSNEINTWLEELGL